MRSVIVLLLILATAPAVWAGEGKLEINQTCAVETGCFPGDSPGFPVTLTASAISSSFVLTSDLDVAAANVDGVRFVADDLTLDLNGFTISGPVACTGTGSAVSCGAGSRFGISASSSERSTVKNGVVTGFGGGGVSMGNMAHVEAVIAWGNGGIGIGANGLVTIRNSKAYANAGAGIQTSGVIEGSVTWGNALSGLFSSGLSVASVVRRNVSYENGGFGIYCAGPCTAVDNGITENEGHGILVDEGSVVRGNVVVNNGDVGIQAQTNVVIRDNSVEGSTNDGIQCQSDCTVVGNRSTSNGARGILANDSVVENNTVRSNGGDGIEATGAMVRGNVSSGNVGFGLDADGETGFSNNVFNGNNLLGGSPGPQVNGSPLPMGFNVNVCNGGASC